MRSPSDPDRHIDSSRFGKRSRREIVADAAREKKQLGLSGRYKRFRVHVNGTAYDVPMPDVRAIRRQLKLSQADFAHRFHLSSRTVQQWEQHRAMPDMPARVLLKAIQRAPDVIARAAAEVRAELEAAHADR